MRQKHYSLGAVVFSVIALVMAVGLCSLKANADDSDDNFVYVMTNSKPQNSIIQFRRANDGSLTGCAKLQAAAAVPELPESTLSALRTRWC
jgi:hypothetical protein